MKKIIYAFRTEFKSKTSFATNMVATTLILYFIFQYMGAYSGYINNYQTQKDYYILTLTPQKEMTIDQLNQLQYVKGFTWGIIKSDYIGPENFPGGGSCQMTAIVGTPAYDYNFNGRPLHENSMYIPAEYSLCFGESFVLAVNKSDGQIKVSDGTENSEDYQIVSFDIIGTCGESIGSSLIVLPSTFLANFSASYFEIYLNSAEISSEEYNAAIKEISKIFDNAEVHNLLSEAYDERISNQLDTTPLYFSLGIICIVFLYSHILSKRGRRFSVCRMCGASKGAIAGVIFIGCMLTYAISFVLAVLLGKVLNWAIFEFVFCFDTFDLSINDFLLFFAFTFAIYLAVCGIYVIRFVKNSAAAVYRRNE